MLRLRWTQGEGGDKSDMVWIGDWKLMQPGRGEMDRAFGVEGSPKGLNGKSWKLEGDSDYERKERK